MRLSRALAIGCIISPLSVFSLFAQSADTGILFQHYRRPARRYAFSSNTIPQARLDPVSLTIKRGTKWNTRNQEPGERDPA